MASRFERVFLLQKELYAAGAPVIVSAGALLKEQGNIFAQLKLTSLSDDTLRALQVTLQPMDVRGQALGAPVTFRYLDLSVCRDAEFGQKTLILLPDRETRGFTVRVTEAVFGSGAVWSGDGTPEPLPARKEISVYLPDAELLREYRTEFGEDCAYQPEEAADLWYCACGAINRQSEDTCHRCKKSRAALFSADLEALEQKKDARLKREAEERAAKAAAKVAAAKKRRRIFAVAAAVLAVCAASAALIKEVIIPARHYSAAVELMEAGSYDEAIAAFEAMDGYKDSTDKISACQTALKDIDYNAAVALMDEGKYSEAITAFAKLKGYKDSADKIAACETALKDIDYYTAVELMNAGNYQEAIAAFEAMDGYRDSKEQIEACETALKDIDYYTAVELMNAGNYQEAIATFEAMNGYRDSEEQIEACETALNYNAAIELMKAGNYGEAFAAFNAIKGYKDSAEQIEIIKAETLMNSQIGSTVFFGTYEQNNITENGKEDIEWLVLDKQDGKVLLISKYALDCQQYNTSHTDVTWENCSLRKWMNGTFLNNAFSAEEQAKIAMTNVSADKNPAYNTNPGNATSDIVFLLSITEAKKYFTTAESRKCAPTAYAKSQGPWTSDFYKTASGEDTCCWLLRSSGNRQDHAALVNFDGSVDYYGSSVDGDDVCVRPAMWISLE